MTAKRPRSAAERVTATLPTLYGRWMGSALGDEIPAETESTCSDCAMTCARTGPAEQDAIYFRPDAKCCTYRPELPNFLVGAILGDTDPSALAARGRASIEERMRGMTNVTPLGLGAGASYDALYKSGPNLFGRSRSLVCPHFVDEDGGVCAIWRQRNSVCTTWFCKHVRGAVGQRFWNALRLLLGEIEVELARWCVLELGLDVGALERLLDSSRGRQVEASELDGQALDAELAPLWGSWRGRERELYVRSAERVAVLDWADVIALCGQRTRARFHLTRQAFEDLLCEDLPAALRVAPFQVVRVGDRETRIVSYSPYDAIELPNEVIASLPEFDRAATTAEARRRIAARHGRALTPSLVRMLVDFGILKAR